MGNNGSLFPDSSQKAALIQLCNQISTLTFFTNITGFNIGKEFEQNGSIKKGAQMLNAVSNSEVPHLTVILGTHTVPVHMPCLEENLVMLLLFMANKDCRNGGTNSWSYVDGKKSKAMRDGLPFDEEDAKL